MSRGVKNLLKYGISTVVGLLMVAVYVFSRDYGARDFWSWTLVNKALVLCDGFTIPGVVFLCIGGLVWASSLGAMDGIGFALKIAIKSLLPGGRKEHIRYYDYVQQRRENRPHGYGFLLLVGAAFMAVALLFMMIFYAQRGI